MKSRVILCFLYLTILFTGLNADEKGPVTVSPGSDVGIAVIGESCPTFSWTAVEWATGYRVEVFEAITAEELSHDKMAVRAIPVISKEIKGQALSWTPSSDERLMNEGLYVWYVQAMDSYGTAKWSEGATFMLKLNDRLGALVDKVTETLKDYGASDEVIGKVLKDMMSEVTEVKTIGINLDDSNHNTTDQIEIQGWEDDDNTFYGLHAGYNVSISFGCNSFFGRSAGYSTTASGDNTFMGYRSGFANKASYNTFVGSYSGEDNLMGGDNTFVGFNAGANNTYGDTNTFLGSEAGLLNTTGSWNTFIGRNSGASNTEGTNNTFTGYLAGYKTTTGDFNTFLGNESGYNNTYSDHNTFIGAKSGYSNETGYYNTYIGDFSGYYGTGNYNTSLGYKAGYNNVSGESNVFLGYQAGYNETSSQKLYIENSNSSAPLIYGEFDNDIVAINGKLGVGTKSPGYNLEVETTGGNAIFLLDRTDGAKAGYAAYSDRALLGTVTNHPLMFGVGYKVKMRLNSDNSLVMTNGAQCTAGGVWQDASSRAYKENIRDLTAVEAKSALFALNPVKYYYKTDREDEHLGFIAEDVPELVASKDRKGMSPMDVVAILTKVVQEQQDTIAELQKRIAKLEKRSP